MSSGDHSGEDRPPTGIADEYYTKTKKLVDACKINRSYDIPWLANRSTDYKTVYIDQRIPKILKCGVDPALSLPWHELSEALAMDDGLPYDTGSESAHVDVANPLERQEVERQKPDNAEIWQTYNDELEGYNREPSAASIKHVPTDMDLRVFSADDRKRLQELIAAESGKFGGLTMTRRHFTVDQFRAEAKPKVPGGVRGNPDGVVVRLVAADPQQVDDTGRKLRFCFSDGSIDRAGDSIDPAGWQLESFMANPVALWAHDSTGLPIGRASNVSAQGGKLMGDIEFATRDEYPFADDVYKLVKGGFLKAVSVGFIPHEWKYSQSAERPFGIDFTKQELVEISVCPVPCNPNALQEAKALGIDVGPMIEWAASVLGRTGSVLIDRDVLEDTFRAAKTPHTLRQRYLLRGDASHWVVGASRSLPIDDADTWDGPAAAKRMLDEAGFDGDSPNASKAKRGFLIYDEANPTLRGSYKLPFADIVGGTLKAVKRGIQAAKGRLNQTDAPQSVLDEAKGVLDAYDKRMGNDDGDKTLKAGRAISAANAKMLQEAMDHHASATDCIKAVLDGSASGGTDDDGDNDAGGPDADDGNGDLVVHPPEKASTRASRLAEVAALKVALKL